MKRSTRPMTTFAMPWTNVQCQGSCAAMAMSPAFALAHERSSTRDALVGYGDLQQPSGRWMT
ncbi:MAG: hypothetical protein JNK75_12520 [Betaproteobacteria bacterium]|nr:hypothetical protein [Betaproteobacteria bacterium]